MVGDGEGERAPSPVVHQGFKSHFPSSIRNGDPEKREEGSIAA